MYWLTAVSATITLLTTDNWNLPHSGFPIYLVAMGGVIGSLITFPIGERVDATLTRHPE